MKGRVRVRGRVRGKVKVKVKGKVKVKVKGKGKVKVKGKGKGSAEGGRLTRGAKNSFPKNKRGDDGFTNPN